MGETAFKENSERARVVCFFSWNASSMILKNYGEALQQQLQEQAELQLQLQQHLEQEIYP